MNEFWDRLGISTSILCILHCLLTPVLVVFLPFAGEELAHGWFHWIIVCVVVPVAIWALWNGYRLHRLKRVLWLGSVGLIFVCLALYVGYYDLNYEIILMISGGLLLSMAHFSNLRQCQRTHH
ncbi:MAG: MerC domain-containing protein [Bdellovibrionales bacterium]|nr:MerC domain-containing protein [Bdellovibrionales bacterium]